MINIFRAMSIFKQYALDIANACEDIFDKTNSGDLSGSVFSACSPRLVLDLGELLLGEAGVPHEDHVHLAVALQCL